MSKPSDGRGRPVSLRDVASHAGVDISTASRALTGQRKVGAETLARVEAAVAALGYAPNQAARNLRLSRTMTIGVVINRFDTPIYLDALEGMGSVCDEQGYSLMITSARADAALYRRLVEKHWGRRVDGLILWTPPDLGDALGPFLTAGVPVLAIGIPEESPVAVPLINVTEAAPIRDAVADLAALGHRALLYLRVAHNVSRPRLPTLEAACARAGIRLIHERLEHGMAMDAFRVRLRRLLAPPDGATAVLADHHHLAQVTAALPALRLRVPDDVSLLGFARSRWAREMWLPIATIQTDAVAFGQAVASLVLGWLNGRRPPDRTEVPVAEWVRRGTIGPAPAR
jgi:LacI family transcriptional regulator